MVATVAEVSQMHTAGNLPAVIWAEMLRFLSRIVVLLLHLEAHERPRFPVRLNDTGEDLLPRPQGHRLQDGRHRHIDVLIG